MPAPAAPIDVHIGCAYDFVRFACTDCRREWLGGVSADLYALNSVAKELGGFRCPG